MEHVKRTFIELSRVTGPLIAAGVSDDSLRAVQRQIMEGRGDVIKGANGLRKIRCAAAGRGKSGGVRIIFADFPQQGKCFLLAAFAKNAQENISSAERQDLAKLKAVLDRQMTAR